MPLELINSNRDLIRKARESFLIPIANTLEPYGMNRRDEIVRIFISFSVFNCYLFILAYYVSAFYLSLVCFHLHLTFLASDEG